MNKVSVTASVAAAVALGYFAVGSLSSEDDERKSAGKKTLVSKTRRPQSGMPTGKTAVRVSPGATALPSRGLNDNSVRKLDPRALLVGLDGFEKENRLNDIEKEVVQMLRDYLDKEISVGRELHEEFAQLLREAHHGPYATMVGRATKLKLLSVLDSIGYGGCSSAIGEALLDYVTDPEPAVARASMERFMQAISDFSLGDRERAQLVLAASITVDNRDDMGWVYSQFATMRHSVAVDTFVKISEHGNDIAVNLLGEEILNYTGDENITTVEDAEKWLKDNPDGEEDEAFYGGLKEGDGIGI